MCQGKAGEAHFVDVSKNLYVLGGTLGPCYTVPVALPIASSMRGRAISPWPIPAMAVPAKGLFTSHEHGGGVQATDADDHPEQLLRHLRGLP